MFYLTGFVLSCFLGLLLIFKNNKSEADTVLLIWMLVIAVHILLSYGVFTGFALQYPHILGLVFPLPVLHGMLLYIYTRLMTGNEMPGIKSMILHLIPALGIVSLATPFYLLSAEEKVRVFENQDKGYEWFESISVSVIVISGLVYSVLSIRTIYRHRKRMAEHFSNTDRKMLRWLEKLSIALGLVWLCVIVADDPVIFAAVSCFVIFIGFMGISQVPVFYKNGEEEAIPLRDTGEVYQVAGVPTYGHAITDHMSDAERPDRAVFTESVAQAVVLQDLTAVDGVYERLQKIIEKTDMLLEETELYKDPDLTLSQLASKTGVSANLLSQAINTVKKKSFYQYINDYRIEAFIRAARQPESKKYTLISLAYDCGFRSKTTFNKYFKLKTGKTPSEYFLIQEVDS